MFSIGCHSRVPRVCVPRLLGPRAGHDQARRSEAREDNALRPLRRADSQELRAYRSGRQLHDRWHLPGLLLRGEAASLVLPETEPEVFSLVREPTACFLPR